MLARLLLVCVVAACSSSTPKTSSTSSDHGSGSATPNPEDAAMSQDRASIYPADQLLAWLDQHSGDEIMIELPVLVTLKPNRMNVKTATVGDKPDALEIKARDNTMAVPIAGKWGQFCPDAGDTCMLVLRGAWRGGPDKEFQVASVVKAVPDGDRATATFATLVK